VLRKRELEPGLVGVAETGELKVRGGASRRLNDALKSEDLACVQAEINVQQWSQHCPTNKAGRERIAGGSRLDDRSSAPM
jgi:hypothetical protein